MQIALIHEWLESYAGAELVVEQILRALDGADVFALVDFLPEDQRGFLQGAKVTTSFLQWLPFARRKFRGYLPLMPLAAEQFDLTAYDLVVSSNHAVAHGVLTREDQLHLCYVHTPVRYAWDLYQPSLKAHRLASGPKSWAVRLILHYLRLWDQVASSRVDAYAANSHYVARRIWKTYRRRAEVIYPPVDVHRFQVEHTKENFYTTVSRLVPYKRVDLMIEAFRRMPNRKLIVIGDGPEREVLSRNLPANVTLLGRQPAEVVNQHLEAARGFLFAADEDFGISPVEAQACGTPVIAYRHGGTTETVVEGKTGIFFPRQDAESIVAAVGAFEECQHQFDPAAIRAHADQFSPERFRSQFDNFVAHHWQRLHRREPARAGVKRKRSERRATAKPR
jgi:glycosyltransferase involved in cell wall biosynthesis